MNVRLGGNTYSIPALLRIGVVRFIWVLAVLAAAVAIAIIAFAEGIDDRPDRWQDDYRR